MKKKTLLTAIFTLAMSASLATLVGCGHTHSYSETTTAPTCTEQGFTTHTCECGDSYIDTYVDALEHEFTNYVSNNDATHEDDGTKTATCNHVNCSETDTLPDIRSKLPSQISFQTLTVNGTDAYGYVSNSTETFSFIDEILEVGIAKFVVSLDIYGIQQITTKTIPLEIGDNTVYITEMINNEPQNVYTVTIRRNPKYTVSFDTDDGPYIPNQIVEEGNVANCPTITRKGYTFLGWDFDFKTPITSSITITAQWEINIYNISYDLNGGILKETTNPTNYTVKTNTIILQTPEKENCAFLGWYNGDKKVEKITIGSTGNLSLVAKWENALIISNNTITGVVPSAKTTCRTINIPNGITTIAADVFSDCIALTSLTIPDSVNHIKSHAFFGCKNLEKIYIPDLTAWCNIQFDTYNSNPLFYAGKLYLNNQPITQLVIPNNITTIKKYAFINCANLICATIPDSVSSIELGAFSYCENLETITLPFVGSSINATENTHFGYIFGAPSSSNNNNYTPSSLKKVIITSATSIAAHAFENCNNLTSVSIPDAVTSIGSSAFSGCNNLIEITLPFVGSKSDGTDKTNFGYIFGANYALHNADYVPASLKKVIITSATEIAVQAFYECEHLVSVTIPDSVITINQYAFAGCSSLVEITLPFIGRSRDAATLTHFGYIFGANSYNQQSKSIPSTLKYVNITNAASISSHAFYLCINVIQIALAYDVVEIGDYAFDNCQKLDSLIITSSIKSIGERAFHACLALKDITFLGTQAQWTSITKGINWKSSVLESISCSDGKITL